MTELHYLSATEALRLFRSRQLSPVELTQALIARAELVEPAVNAFAERMFEQALHAAAEAERRYALGGEEPRPLEGLPVSVKEEQDIAGHAITEGTLLTRSRRAMTTAVLPARIQAAGGILHARTTTSEFCCMPMSHTLRWGVTRNPWNLQASAGGSSGGSAASLASGTSMLSTGSDIGGSIRAPASFTGVVGFKPPHGRNPAPAPMRLDTYYHQGPLARTVADCALLQNTVVGPDPRDVRSLRPIVRIPERLAGVRGLRVAFSDAPGDFPVDPEIRALTRAAAEALRSEGAVVEEVDLAWRLNDVKRAMGAHFGDSLAARILALAEERPDSITPYTLAFARKSADLSRRVGVDEGRMLEADLYDRLGDVLERFDALILPTMGALAFAAGEDYVDTPLVVDGIELDDFSDASLTSVFNICSACPVLSVPSGLASNGVPTGVQVVGRTYDDVTAFRVAQAVERVRGATFAGQRTPTLPSLPTPQADEGL
jgi:aspartyl-tRNA(Asn)/glutamyl-tRNA(Gln) amidotransferase subunit A